MKKGLTILILTAIMLLMNATILFGSAFNIAGGSLSDRYNLKFESFALEPMIVYIDAFKFEYLDASLTTMILGVEYFLIPYGDHYGLYIGAGLPLFRDLSNDDTFDTLENRLGSAFESGVEYRAGFRFIVSEDYPFFDIGYSNVKKMFFDLGVNF